MKLWKIVRTGFPKTTTAGLAFLLLGVILFVIRPRDIIHRWCTVFTSSSPAFELWVKPKWEIFLKVYIFNITNVQAFINNEDEKLKLQEVGPIVYRERGEHSNPIFNHENGTITTHPFFYYEKIPETNETLEETTLMLPHVALLMFADRMSRENILFKIAVNSFFQQTNSKPIVPQTAKEFMFGYESSLLTVGNTFMSDWISFSKLGIVDRSYDSKGDVSTTFSGELNTDLTGLIDTYNHLPYLPQWEPPCNRLQLTSDGMKFPNNIKPNQTLMFYRKSICRTIPLLRSGPLTSTVWGVPTARYKFQDNALDNGHMNQENKCFCRDGNCLPSGMIDITDCFYGFRMALSYPHFYKANVSLLDGVEGLKPDENQHGSYFDINPETGTVTNGSVKFQMNAVLGDLSDFTCCKRFSNMIIPLAWLEIVSPDIDWFLSIKIFILIKVLPIADIVTTSFLIIFGIFLLIYSIYKHITFTYRFVNKNEEQLTTIKNNEELLLNTKHKSQSSMTDAYGNPKSDPSFRCLLMPKK